jgi:hypothetical protein
LVAHGGLSSIAPGYRANMADLAGVAPKAALQAVIYGELATDGKTL